MQEINLDEYEKKQEIGKGGFGQIYLATHKPTGKEVAIKEMQFELSEKEEREIKNSLEVYNLNLPGLVKILGACKKDKKYIIVMEYFKNGPADNLVEEYLESNGAKHEKMNPTIRSKIIFGIASLMKQMHQKNAIFRDVKLRKVCLDDNLEPKLLHNSLAKIIEDPLNMTMAIGTPFCMAPELFIDDEETYSFPVDVYSYAFLVYKMFSPQINLEGKKIRSSQQYMMYISKGIRPVKPASIPEHYWELIQKCWKGKPNERLTFEQIVNLLKDDKYALEEFGMKTNLDELHDYQKRIEG